MSHGSHRTSHAPMVKWPWLRLYMPTRRTGPDPAQTTMDVGPSSQDTTASKYGVHRNVGTRSTHNHVTQAVLVCDTMRSASVQVQLHLPIWTRWPSVQRTKRWRRLLGLRCGNREPVPCQGTQEAVEDVRKLTQPAMRTSPIRSLTMGRLFLMAYSASRPPTPTPDSCYCERRPSSTR